MRDVTSKVVRAFLDRKCCTNKATRTDGDTLYLHGNAIAWRPYSDRNPDAICMTLAGWNTVTTRERLNGLCDMLFKQRPFHQRKRTPHFAGTEINERDVLVWYPGITDAGQMLAATMMTEDDVPVLRKVA